MNSNNIVIFPREYNGPKPESMVIDEITQNVEMMKHYHIQETIANIAPLIFNQLDIAGFDVGDEEALDIKQGAFLIESLRAIMCKYYGIYHPFQALSENIFHSDEEDTTVLRIAESININLKPNEVKPN